ncbi:hypothetical protein FRC07_010346 [Ceratobasidium sp. 392]|nr:hypothetical protein FRC07_010346 [Ceratobasidium sp. 392]
MDFTSRMFGANRPPKVHISQYTSANRQMSLPPDVDNNPGVTIPWLLSPKWHTSGQGNTIRTQASQSPQVAIKTIHSHFQALQLDFFCPYSLEFKNGEPIVDSSYVEVLQYQRECSALLVELRGLRVPEEFQDQHSEETAAISKAVQEIDNWVEGQRVLALAMEERMMKEIAEQRRMQLEQNSQGIGSTISWFVRKMLPNVV